MGGTHQQAQEEREGRQEQRDGGAEYGCDDQSQGARQASWNSGGPGDQDEEAPGRLP